MRCGPLLLFPRLLPPLPFLVPSTCRLFPPPDRYFAGGNFKLGLRGGRPFSPGLSSSSAHSATPTSSTATVTAPEEAQESSISSGSVEAAGSSDARPSSGLSTNNEAVAAETCDETAGSSVADDVAPASPEAGVEVGVGSREDVHPAEGQSSEAVADQRSNESDVGVVSTSADDSYGGEC
jgi:hypothetical protein